MPAPVIAVRVTGVRQLTPRVREYLLSDPEGRPLPRFEPGAHIELHLSSPDGSPIVRHYSLIGGCGVEDDPAETYRIAVQREDRKRGSAHIHDSFEIGTALAISYPRNNFPLNRRDKHSLLLAGGIGITPILSMLRSLVRRKRSYEIVYSGRTRDQLAFAEDVQRMTAGAGRLHFSGDPPTDHLDVPALLAAQPAETTVYVCGPASMIAATHRAAGELGWRVDRVRSEMFTSAAAADDVAFEVSLKRSGRTIHVGRDSSILDAMIAAGLQPLFDCRRGECGLCPLPVLEHDGPIQHRDRYLSEAEHLAGREMCICVSRIKGATLVLDA